MHLYLLDVGKRGRWAKKVGAYLFFSSETTRLTRHKRNPTQKKRGKRRRQTLAHRELSAALPSRLSVARIGSPGESPAGAGALRAAGHSGLVLRGRDANLTRGFYGLNGLVEARPRCPPRHGRGGRGRERGSMQAELAHAAALAPAYMCAGAGAAEGQTGLAIAVVSRGPVRRWRPRGRLRRRHRGRPHGAHCGVARGRRARAITRGPSW